MRVKFGNCLVQQLFQVLYIAIVDLDLDRGGGNNTISRVVEWDVQIAEVKQEKRKKLISLPFYQRVSTHSKQIILIKLRSEKSARGSVIKFSCWKTFTLAVLEAHYIKKRNFETASHSSDLESNRMKKPFACCVKFSAVFWHWVHSRPFDMEYGLFNFQTEISIKLPKLINGLLWSLIVTLIRMVCKF